VIWARTRRKGRTVFHRKWRVVDTTSARGVWNISSFTIYIWVLVFMDRLLHLPKFLVASRISWLFAFVYTTASTKQLSNKFRLKSDSDSLYPISGYHALVLVVKYVNDQLHELSHCHTSIEFATPHQTSQPEPWY
jgi:hypothetical protein